jgi:hypothetical protein
VGFSFHSLKSHHCTFACMVHSNSCSTSTNISTNATNEREHIYFNLKKLPHIHVCACVTHLKAHVSFINNYTIKYHTWDGGKKNCNSPKLALTCISTVALFQFLWFICEYFDSYHKGEGREKNKNIHTNINTCMHTRFI